MEENFVLVRIEQIDKESAGLRGQVHFDFRDILKVEHLQNIWYVQVVQTRDAIWVIDDTSVKKLSSGPDDDLNHGRVIPLPIQRGNLNSIFWVQ